MARSIRAWICTRGPEIAMELRELLYLAVENQASDLYFKPGRPPALRIHGELEPVPGEDPLTPEQVEQMVREITNEAQQARFETEGELDFSFAFEQTVRFRVNVGRQRGQVGAFLRALPFKIPTLRELGFPPSISELALKPRGLVLVVGPTGSGKSTTLAAMVDLINSTRHGHIVTIEDPIEYWHEDKLCYIDQREVGHDTESFATALKRVFRQDPDVIMVGEMRDPETIATAITAAETGHLVLTTLHTAGAEQAVDRIIDIYPPGQQEQIRLQLSMTLQGVVSQTLLPRRDGTGRICAMEILIGTLPVRNLIREGKTHEIRAVMQTSGGIGMQTLDDALLKLYQRNVISRETALGAANDPALLTKRLSADTPSAPVWSGQSRF